MALVGITGGIGAGKSTVLGVFQKLGCRTFDADEIVHALYAPGGEGAVRLAAHWGKTVLTADGAVDRRAVARIVFADEAERQWLNQTVHPLVQARLLSAAQQSSDPVYGAIPLLFESSWQNLCECTVAVWCRRDQQRDRLLERGWTANEIAARLVTQLDMDAKINLADYVLVNSGDLFFLAEQCQHLHRHLTGQQSHLN